MRRFRDMLQRRGRTRSRWPVVLGLIVVALALVPVVAHAQTDLLENTVSFIAVHLIYPVVQLLGKLLIALINILVSVAQYNDFTRAVAVQKGFTIVRDVANMFFIVFLLVIAFGTILNLQTYRYNRLLGKLVLMAFLVNFAKLISGFFIDFAQVVMLTFVNAFRSAAAGNLTTAFGLEELLQFRDEAPQDISGYAIVGALLLALALLIIAVIIVGVYVVVLLVRIVALWLLIILSPLAYVLEAFPSGKKYASQWWDNFSKYVVCGPVIAFFFWLSLTVVATTSTESNLSKEVVPAPQLTELQGGGTPLAGQPVSSGTPGATAAAITSISQSDHLLSYMVAILLLLGAMMVAQQMCGAAGKFASQWTDRAKRAAMWATGVTAAMTYGQKAVQKTWETGWGGTKALVGSPFGRISRAYQQSAPAWAQPWAVVRGWKERREEQKKQVQAVATARGRNFAERMMTRGKLNLDHEGRVEAGFEAQFAKDFGHLSKEQMAEQAERLDGMGGVEGRRYKNSLATTAAGHGYLDDIFGTEYFRKKYAKDFPDKTYKDKFGNDVPVSDEFYGFQRLNVALHKYLGSDRQSQRAIDTIGEIGKKVGHSEYKGHNRYVGKGKFQRLLGHSAVEESIAEFRKNSQRDAQRSQVHSFARLRNRFKRNKDTGEILKDLVTGEKLTDVSAGVIDEHGHAGLEKTTAGADVGQLKQHSTSRLNDFFIAPTEEFGADGVLRGDAVDAHHIKTLSKFFPNLLSAMLIRSLPPGQKTLLFEQYDDKDGNYMPGNDLAVSIQGAEDKGGLGSQDPADLQAEASRLKAAGHWTGAAADADIAARRKGAGSAAAGAGATAGAAAGGGAAGTAAGAAAGAGAAGGAAAGAPLRDVAAEKRELYAQMKQGVADHEKEFGQGSFWKSDLYQRFGDDFLTEEEFESMKSLEERGVAEVGGVASFGSGASNTLAFNAETFAGGKFRDFAGVYMNEPAQIAAFAEEYLKVLQDESQQIDATGEKEGRALTAGEQQRKAAIASAQERLQAALANPESLQDLELINTGRAGYTDRHAIGHEGSHRKLDQIDADGSLREELLGRMSAEEQEAMRQRMAKKFGNPDISVKAAFEEHLAEGLTNAWDPWADADPDAVKLDPATLKDIQARGKGKGKNGQDVTFLASGDPATMQLEKLPRFSRLRGFGKQLASLTATAGYSLEDWAAGKFKQGGGFLKAKAGAAAGRLGSTTVGRKTAEAATTVGRKTSEAAKTVAESPVVQRSAAGMKKGFDAGAKLYRKLLPTEEQKLVATRLDAERAAARSRVAMERSADKKRVLEQAKIKEKRVLRQNGDKDAELVREIQGLEAEKKTAQQRGDIGQVKQITDAIADKTAQRGKLRKENTQATKEREFAERLDGKYGRQATFVMNDARSRQQKFDELTNGLSQVDVAKIEAGAKRKQLEDQEQKLKGVDKPEQGYQKRSAKRFKKMRDVDAEHASATAELEAMDKARDPIFAPEVSAIQKRHDEVRSILDAPKDVQRLEQELAEMEGKRAAAQQAGRPREVANLSQGITNLTRSLQQKRALATTPPAQRQQLEQEFAELTKRWDAARSTSLAWRDKREKLKDRRLELERTRSGLQVEEQEDSESKDEKMEALRPKREKAVKKRDEAAVRYAESLKRVETVQAEADLGPARQVQAATGKALADADARLKQALAYKREGGVYQDTPADRSAREEENAAQAAFREAQRKANEANTRVAALEKQAGVQPPAPKPVPTPTPEAPKVDVAAARTEHEAAQTDHAAKKKDFDDISRKVDTGGLTGAELDAARAQQREAIAALSAAEKKAEASAAKLAAAEKQAAQPAAQAAVSVASGRAAAPAPAAAPSPAGGEAKPPVDISTAIAGLAESIGSSADATKELYLGLRNLDTSLAANRRAIESLRPTLGKEMSDALHRSLNRVDQVGHGPADVGRRGRQFDFEEETKRYYKELRKALEELRGGKSQSKEKGTPAAEKGPEKITTKPPPAPPPPAASE